METQDMQTETMESTEEGHHSGEYLEYLDEPGEYHISITCYCISINTKLKHSNLKHVGIRVMPIAIRAEIPEYIYRQINKTVLPLGGGSGVIIKYYYYHYYYYYYYYYYY